MKREIYNPSEDFEGEKWHQLEDSQYFISNYGRIHSSKYLIKPQLNKRTGLMQAMTYQNNKAKLINIQAWVGRYFLLPPDDDKMIVRHISDDLTDNRVSNLIWGYPGHLKYARGNSKKYAIQDKYTYIIRQYTSTGLCFATYIGFDELERQGFKRAGIIAQAKGKSVRYKGYKFTVERRLN